MLSKAPPVLVAENVHKSVQFANEPLLILKGISLEITTGETVAIVGSSGSGKTTLLGLLAGLDVPTQGKIELKGQDLTRLNEDQRADIRARSVGFVFQNFQLLPSLTALENVMLPMELKGESSAEQQARRLLERVGLGSRERHFPRQLSGGEQQRVALARAFACQPEILFADEPTGNLDTNTGNRIVDLLFELNREHATTLLLVTHDSHLAQRCGRSVHLEGGEIVAIRNNHDPGHDSGHDIGGAPSVIGENS
jgi:putative ABC transport system ATP-binding protein